MLGVLLSPCLSLSVSLSLNPSSPYFVSSCICLPGIGRYSSCPYLLPLYLSLCRSLLLPLVARPPLSPLVSVSLCVCVSLSISLSVSVCLSVPCCLIRLSLLVPYHLYQMNLPAVSLFSICVSGSLLQVSLSVSSSCWLPLSPLAVTRSLSPPRLVLGISLSLGVFNCLLLSPVCLSVSRSLSRSLSLCISCCRLSVCLSVCLSLSASPAVSCRLLSVCLSVSVSPAVSFCLLV